MSVAEFAHDEKLVLLGLVRLMIRLDGEFSTGERELLDNLVADLGEDSFETLSAEANEKMQDEDAIKYYAERVTRQAAQEEIYGILYSLAIPGSIVPAESSLLAWLEERWSVGKPQTPYRD